MKAKSKTEMSEARKRLGYGFRFVSRESGISKHSTVVFESEDGREDYGSRITRQTAKSFSWRPHQIQTVESSLKHCKQHLVDGCWGGEENLPSDKKEQVRQALEPRVWEQIYNTYHFRLDFSDSPDCPKGFEEVEGGDELHDIALTAVWADMFEEKFSTTWLAAVALEVLLSEQNEFAFGFRYSELIQKLEHEEDALRGKKVMKAAQSGGTTKSKMSNARSVEIIENMKACVESGHSISGAASICAKRNIGTSHAANRRLWQRHFKKT
jgi:hypothetical protein